MTLYREYSFSHEAPFHYSNLPRTRDLFRNSLCFLCRNLGLKLAQGQFFTAQKVPT